MSSIESFTMLRNIFGDNPFFPIDCTDFDPANLEGWVKSFEVESFIPEIQLPGRAMALHLASPGKDGVPNWNTESNDYITDFKLVSQIDLCYTMQPITMLRCNSKMHTVDMVPIPDHFPVTFRVHKRVGNDLKIVKYLQYTETGNLCHYTPK